MIEDTDMNILPEIANRRSVRKYNDRDISDEQIAATLLVL